MTDLKPWGSRSARARLFFADREYEFGLQIGEVEELQELTGYGPQALWKRAASGEWGAKDLVETIRLGLVGGGMEREKAWRLVDRHVKPGYFAYCAILAETILKLAIWGVEEEPLGEPTPAKARKSSGRSRKADSASPASTD